MPASKQPPQIHNRRTSVQIMIWLVFALIITPLYGTVVFFLLEMAENLLSLHSSLFAFARTISIIPYIVIFITT